MSLQKDGDVTQAPFQIHDWMGECRDFADTAALASNLDLILSGDTAIVHLASALGRPTWLLNRADPAWIWGLGREDSVWYPTLRQFRQQTKGDWAGVVAEVRQALMELVQKWAA